MCLSVALPAAGEDVADAVTLAELPASVRATSTTGGGAGGDASPGGGGGTEGGDARMAEAGPPGAEPGQQQQEGAEEGGAEEEEEAEEHLGWLPATLAAVALRLQSLDAALRYGSPEAQPAAREALPAYHCVQRPTADGVVCGQPLGERQRVPRAWGGLGSTAADASQGLCGL